MDEAQAVNELNQEVSLANARARGRAPAHFNGRDCAACEEPVEKKRLALGLYTCLECARRIEHHRKMYAK